MSTTFLRMTFEHFNDALFKLVEFGDWNFRLFKLGFLQLNDVVFPSSGRANDVPRVVPRRRNNRWSGVDSPWFVRLPFSSRRSGRRGPSSGVGWFVVGHDNRLDAPKTGRKWANGDVNRSRIAGSTRIHGDAFWRTLVLLPASGPFVKERKCQWCRVDDVGDLDLHWLGSRLSALDVRIPTTLKRKLELRRGSRLISKLVHPLLRHVFRLHRDCEFPVWISYLIFI